MLDNALLTAQSGLTLAEASADREAWGRLTESAIGAHLANAAASGDCELYYWIDRNREVDFVVRAGRKLTAIEVKSGRTRGAFLGMQAFAGAFEVDRRLLVGGDGVPIEEILMRPVTHWVG